MIEEKIKGIDDVRKKLDKDNIEHMESENILSDKIELLM